MRIEIVVNERNMSESSLKHGPKRSLTVSERKCRKRESIAKLNKNRIYIGSRGQCDRWNELRSVQRVETNAEVARFLLDWQVKCNCLHFSDENKSYIVIKPCEMTTFYWENI